jgi:hypothetical protein
MIMGWLEYRAEYYKNGKVDRKAEMDSKFNWEDESRKVEVLKSSMVGSTYYAAVKSLNKTNGYECVTAAVCLTSTNAKDYFNFAYKDMDESMGPYNYDCPKGILDMLTPTENEYALEWRKKCYEQLAKKKDPNALNKLPVGTEIKVVMPFDTKYFREGQEVRLRKRTKWGSNRTEWITMNGVACRFTASLMRLLEENYEIIKRGE